MLDTPYSFSHAPQTRHATSEAPLLPQSPPPSDQVHVTRFDWLCAAAQLPGKAAALGLLLSWLASQCRSACVCPTRRMLRRFGVSRDACYDGLRRLEDAKLVHVRRLPGRSPQVILLEPSLDQRLRVT